MRAETQEEWHQSSYQQAADEEASIIGLAFTNRNRTAQGYQMKINEAYPSKWLRASDIGNKTVPVTIHSVTMEQFQDGTNKPAVWFQGKEKALILNKTNATTIAASYGDDTDAWHGRPIELFSMKVQGPSGLVDGLRVKIPQQAATAPAVGQAAIADDDLNDDIPF